MKIKNSYIIASIGLALILTLSSVLTRISAEQKVSVMSYGTKGNVFTIGDTISSFIQIKNWTKDAQTYWIGASMIDPRGIEFPSPSHKVTVLPGGRSGKEESHWNTSLLASKMTSGKHTIILSVWDSQPEKGPAHRLASVQCKPIDIFRGIDDFDTLDPSIWTQANHRLGRGTVASQNTAIQNKQLVLTALPAFLEGAEIQSKDTFLYGSYRARIQTPISPSSLTGFFLYTEPDFYYEIDIEILNRPRSTIMFTTYAGGKKTNTKSIPLKFDPSKAFHEYRFDYYPNHLSFYVDGKLAYTVSHGLPQKPMRLMINHWFPDWLPELDTTDEKNLYVDWVKY